MLDEKALDVIGFASIECSKKDEYLVGNSRLRVVWLVSRLAAHPGRPNRAKPTEDSVPDINVPAVEATLRNACRQHRIVRTEAIAGHQNRISKPPFEVVCPSSIKSFIPNALGGVL